MATSDGAPAATLREYVQQVILLPTVGRERELAETILELLDEVEPIRGAATPESDVYDRMGRYHAALYRIAAGPRPDGTYNLSREACEQIAKEALGERHP